MLVVDEQLSCQRHQRVQATLKPCGALLGTQGQPRGPRRGVLRVVLCLSTAARCELREPLNRGTGPAGVQRHVPRGGEEDARDGVPEVSVGHLEEVGVGELDLRPEVGEVVLVPARRVVLAGCCVELSGMSQVVECHVEQSDVILDPGRSGDPFTQALRQDQAVVGVAEYVGEQRVGRCCRAGRLHYRFTPSGTS